jgi:hypothetical protein
MYRNIQIFLMVVVETVVQLVWYFLWIILLVRQRNKFPRQL